MLAEQFEYAYSSSDSYLLESEGSGPFITLQVRDKSVDQDGLTIEVSDAEGFVGAVLRLIIDEIGFPNSKKLGCLLVVNNVSGGLMPFEADIEVTSQRDPIVVTFNDRSAVQIENPSGMISIVERPGDVVWAEQCESGKVQIAVESVIALVGELDVKRALSLDDRLNLEAALSILETLVRASKPDKGLLRAAASWIGSKLDMFATEFAKTGGKTSAYVTVAVIEIVLSKHFGPLKEHIDELLKLSQS